MHSKNLSISQNHPFLLGRHGQSVLNAGEKIQGKAQGRGDIPSNGLTDKGREQARNMYHALDAAGVTILRVTSSRLLRAQETAAVFMDSHPQPKPIAVNSYVADLEEVSQVGWEMRFTREEVMQLRQESLAKEIESLIVAGLDRELKDYVAWINVLGNKGESPIAAALRGIRALETYEVKGGDLIISHSMLNRYMDAIATRIKKSDRQDLFEAYTTAVDPPKKIALIKMLQKLGLPPYNVDDSRNKVANGGVTEYIVDHASGIWIAGRRIEPSQLSESQSFIEHKREANGSWTRITPMEKK